MPPTRYSILHRLVSRQMHTSDRSAGAGHAALSVAPPDVRQEPDCTGERQGAAGQENPGGDPEHGANRMPPSFEPCRARGEVGRSRVQAEPPTVESCPARSSVAVLVTVDIRTGQGGRRIPYLPLKPGLACGFVPHVSHEHEPITWDGPGGVDSAPGPGHPGGNRMPRQTVPTPAGVTLADEQR